MYLKLLFLTLFLWICVPVFGQDMSPTPAKTIMITPPSAINNDVSFSCSGNNPIWGLEINKNSIRYTVPQMTDVMIQSTEPLSPAGPMQYSVKVYETTTVTDKKPISIVLKKNDMGCTASSGSIPYSYDAYIIFSDKVLIGCCNANMGATQLPQ